MDTGNTHWCTILLTWQLCQHHLAMSVDHIMSIQCILFQTMMECLGSHHKTVLYKQNFNLSDLLEAMCSCDVTVAVVVI